MEGISVGQQFIAVETILAIDERADEKADERNEYENADIAPHSRRPNPVKHRSGN